MNTIAARLANIKQQIHDYEKKYHRPKDAVKLLAVTKSQPVNAILETVHAGQTAFGENYLQESLEKITALTNNHLEWHFIGPIQRNKTKKIAENFLWVHSIDNKLIAERLHDQRPTHFPPLNICIQVNIDGEKTKSGVQPECILPLIEYCLSLPRLKVRGLMAIPEPKHIFIEQRQTFQQVSQLFNHLQEKGFLLDTLSMGMSEDFEAAIAEGATIVRIGTGIFGARI